MADFQFEIQHKSGKYNVNADALSRIRFEENTTKNETLVITRSQTKNYTPLQKNNSHTVSSNDKVGNNKIDITHKSSNDLGSSLPNRTHSERNITCLTDPKEIDDLIREYHCSMLGGHQGIAKTYAKLKNDFSFPKMLSTIRHFINRCEKCQKNKCGKPNRIPMKITTTSSKPFEKVFMDIVGPLPCSSTGKRYILTMQDDLSKFCIASSLETQDARNVAESFVETFICNFGTPEILVTDQGKNFISELFLNVCKILKIKKYQTTPYHPESNGSLERSHASLANYLRNYVDQNLSNWDKLLPFAMFAYNTSVHTSTQFSPFEILYGTKPNLPSSFIIPEKYCYDDYFLDLQNKLQDVYLKAKYNLHASKIRSKSYFDQKTKPFQFHVGEKVLVKNKNRNKLEANWNGPYEITRIDSPENTTVRIKNKLKKYHNKLLIKFME